MNNKIKLFETVLGISEKGAASLTSSERSLIESETRALLNAAPYKRAMKAPEGFDAFLNELQTSENADEAYSMILKFIQTDGGEESMGGKPDMGMEGPGKGPGKPDMGMDMGGKPDMDMGGKPDMDMGGKPDMDMGGKPDMDMGGKPDMDMGGKPDMDMGGKPDMEGPGDLEDKDDKPKGPPKDKGPGKSDDKKDKKDKEDKKPEKDLDKDKKDLMAKIKKAEEDKEEEKEEDKEDEKEASILIPGNPASASKVKVRITSSKNILAGFDGKPLFHAIPTKAVKADNNALKRLANKVYGWLVYEGIESAAKKCGAKLFAGVDSDIEVAFDKEISQADKGIIEEGDNVLKDELEKPEDDVQNEAEFDTQETRSKVDAGIEDKATFVTKETYDSKPSEVTDEESNVIKDGLDTPENDSRDEADVDYKNVEGNYRKLYAARAQEMAKKANKAFVERFIRSVKIASQRMALNYDAHPYKAAALDVLAEAGLEEDVAQELTEEISEEGHNEFVAQLLERTSKLMKKSDEYLEDLETDLKDMQPKPVEVSKASHRRSKKSENMRKAASAGNFALSNVGTPVTRSAKLNQNVGGIRAAVGDSTISRLASAMAGQQ